MCVGIYTHTCTQWTAVHAKRWLFYNVAQIKAHGSVLWSPRKHAHKYIDRNNKVMILHICSSVIPYLNGTKLTLEVVSTQGRPHFKFEENLPKHAKNMSKQTFKKMSSFRGLQGALGVSIIPFAHFQKLL